jgi:hypothetical protein
VAVISIPVFTKKSPLPRVLATAAGCAFGLAITFFAFFFAAFLALAMSFLSFM